jgi:hypothetical protein
VFDVLTENPFYDPVGNKTKSNSVKIFFEAAQIKKKIENSY